MLEGSKPVVAYGSPARNVPGEALLPRMTFANPGALLLPATVPGLPTCVETSRSGTPSPFTSAIAIESGVLKLAGGTGWQP